MSALNIVRPSETQKNALARVALDLQFIFGRSEYTKFVTVGTARTGSTLLISLLNAHSQVLAFGELFRSRDAIGWDVPPFATYQSPKLLALYRSDPVAFLNKNVFRRWPRRYAAVGFKLFYYHARTVVWKFLARRPDVRILHIKRRNILEQYVSLRLAHKTGIWSSSYLTPQPQPIRLDVEKCRRHFAWVRRLEGKCDDLFKSHEIKTVYYEDLIASQQSEMNEIQRFLRLGPERLDATLVRQRRGSLSQLITNYDELRRAFTNTEWSGFFPEPSSSTPVHETNLRA